MNIGCLGPVGQFSEEAARLLFGGDGHHFVLLPSIPAVFQALSSGTAHIAVLPETNTLIGTIEATASGLASLSNARLVHELTLPVHQHLLGVYGSRTDQIREAWSNPAALMECSNWLRSRHIRTRMVGSTAESAKMVSVAGRTDVAAIASEFAAEHYGLSILKRDIQDSERNETRFIAVMYTKAE